MVLDAEKDLRPLGYHGPTESLCQLVCTFGSEKEEMTSGLETAHSVLLFPFPLKHWTNVVLTNSNNSEKNYLFKK